MVLTSREQKVAKDIEKEYSSFCRDKDCDDCKYSKYLNAGVGCRVVYTLDYLRNAGIDIIAPVEWSIVPVDTKILVRQSDACKWEKRHFAKYEDGYVFAFMDGGTSFTEPSTMKWNIAELFEEEE